MKYLIIALVLIMPTATMAQDPTQMPQIMPFVDKDGKQIGTASVWGNKITIRDLKGEPMATIVYQVDGQKTIYDANGKILDRIEGSVKQ